MSRTFLSQDQLASAKADFAAPSVVPKGKLTDEFSFPALDFSKKLSLILENIFKADPDWEQSEPIIIGSWARGELVPKSDYDFIFVGPEENVKNLVDRFHSKGMKIRYRIPADLNDWSKGVEVFDILALMKARPMTASAATKLAQQQEFLRANLKKNRRAYLRAIIKERNEREMRFDSIANFLEPNIKYGPGALRDLEQGLQIRELFHDKFENDQHVLKVLQYYKEFWLTVRQRLHLEGFNDTLSGQSQFELARWFGFQNQKEFMREIQRGLSRVHFYANWIAEIALSSKEKNQRYEKIEFSHFSEPLKALKKDQSLLMQKKVREYLDRVYSDSAIKMQSKQRGQFLRQIISVTSSDDLLKSVFSSRLIDKMLPEIQHLIGYVQHDQYHRFAADIHIQQACRELKRVYKKPHLLGPLKKNLQKMKASDWEILSWTCLYHDLAKGLETQGKDHDHAKIGLEIVKKNFKQFRVSKRISQEVQWMVENHLELSVAAFRKNPKAQSTWDELTKIGCDGMRLHRLAIFTAVDIRATNPEAWNDWKAKLLFDLVATMESSSVQSYFGLKRAFAKNKISPDLLQQIDPLLVSSLSGEVLASDLRKIILEKKDQLPMVICKNKNIWIRFHSLDDRKGLLADYVQMLYAVGLNVRHAVIQTIPLIGVYDWFQVSSKRNASQVEKLLRHATPIDKSIPQVKFDEISFVSADPNEWVISFKGIDQAGLLAAAAASLSELGCHIRSAKVHTWGRQIDDIFMLEPMNSKEELIIKLNKKFNS